MTDPEAVYHRLVSGDAGAIRALAHTLASTTTSLDDARSGIYDASTTTNWTGSAAAAFEGRTARLANGVSVNRTAVARARGALDTAATAYASANVQADRLIGYWRNRPADLPEVVEELFARLVRAYLLEVSRSYNEQLAAVRGVVTGQDVDLDGLDAETKAWVQQGLEKNDEWARNGGSELGPLIPSTKATGDDRGLIPQGLGYDPRTGTLLQSSYTKAEGDGATMSLIDETTGKPIGEVKLGGPATGRGLDEQAGPGPDHAGGVTVDGDAVYVTDKGKVYTYSLSKMREAGPRATVRPSSTQGLDGGSYSAVHDGRLYLGDFENNKMYVYEKGPSGRWQPATDSDGDRVTVDTPDEVQGVVVRDGEYVFSSSYGRGNEGSLIVQDAGDPDQRSCPYTLPNMSEGVVEVDGRLVTTYESGAGFYAGSDDDLWASQYMTETPLSELGLGQDVDVDTGSLRSAALALDGPADRLSSVSSTVGGVDVQAQLFGQVPAAGGLARAVNQLVDGAASSLRTGSRAVAHASDALMAAHRAYKRSDQASRDMLARLHSHRGPR